MSEGGKGRRVLLTVIGVIVTVGIGKVIGGFLGESAAQGANEASPRIAAVASQIAPVIAVISMQDTEGTSEADLDLDARKRLEQMMVDITLRRGRENYAKQGFDPKSYNPKVEANSVYMMTGGKKLVVIRMSIDSQARTVWVMGFHRGQFVRVTCIRASNHHIPIFSGACGQKITEAFDVSITFQAGVTTTASPTKADDPSALITAARNGDLRTVQALVANGANVNARTSFGYSALSGAATKGHTEVVRFLLDKGVSVNERLRGGTNALGEASFWGHLGTVRLLLARGANPNMQKDNGYTPLISAAMNGHLPIVKLLIERGADVNARSQTGSTALHAAAVPGQTAVIDLLLKHGADPDIRNQGGYTYKDLLARKR